MVFSRKTKLYKVRYSLNKKGKQIQCLQQCKHRIRIMVFNAIFNNISVISWWSVLVVEETGVPGENHRPIASHLQTLSHKVVISTPRHEQVSNSQLQWSQTLIEQVVINPTNIRSLPRRPLMYCKIIKGLLSFTNVLYAPFIKLHKGRTI